MHKIGDLASATRVSVETIRYYEPIGLLSAPPRTGGKQRLYSQDDIGQLKFIVRGRGMGFSPADVRLLMSLASGDMIPCDDVRSLAERHLAVIRARITELRTVESLLSSAVAKCPGGEVRNCAVIDVIEGERDNNDL